jgi:hypothetical protein
LAFVLTSLPAISLAHPGNTASDGAHYCRTNCDYWGEAYGERHYHGGGYEESEPEPEYNEYEYDDAGEAVSGDYEPTSTGSTDTSSPPTSYSSPASTTKAKEVDTTISSDSQADKDTSPWVFLGGAGTLLAIGGYIYSSRVKP